MIISSSPSSLISLPDHLPNSTRSPALTSSGCNLPPSSRAPGPTASTSASIGFSFAVSGMMMPPGVFSSASTRLTRTRSCKGLKPAIMLNSVPPGRLRMRLGGTPRLVPALTQPERQHDHRDAEDQRVGAEPPGHHHGALDRCDEQQDAPED